MLQGFRIEGIMDERQQEKKESRRKRRIRNQVAAYIVVMIFIMAVGAGAVFGVRQLAQHRKAMQDKQQGSQDALDGMLATEPEIPTPPPETSPEPTAAPEPTREERLDELAEELIAMMPLEAKVAGLFIVTPESITGVGTAVKAGDGTRSALEKYAVGGIVYSSKNIKSEAQFKEMLENTKQYSAYPLFLAAEEEGGKRQVTAAAGIGVQVDPAQKIGE